MKTIFIICFAIFCGFKSNAQQDTLNPLTFYEIGDTLFGSLDNLVNTGRLYNRLLERDTAYTPIWHVDTFQGNNQSIDVTGDVMYNFLNDLKNMSIDTSEIPSIIPTYQNASILANEYAFEQDRFVFPIGILEYDYNYIDTTAEKQNGNIDINNYIVSVNNNFVNLQTKTVSAAGPMFDYFDTPTMGIIFNRENFFSDKYTFDSIQEIKIVFKGDTAYLVENEIYYFTPKEDSVQNFYAEIKFFNNHKITNRFIIQTPYLYIESLKNKPKADGYPNCTTLKIEDQVDELEDAQGNKIKWCLMPRCGWNGRISKPYIMVTGYRPPFLQQSYEKTWQFYNTEHGEMLQKLRDENFDIILVRFNIHSKLLKHGINESAELFIRFLKGVNLAKIADNGHENVIQANSMGTDIARLALLRMEKNHMTYINYPHHHSRLLFAYDANIYGANLPLAYQYQVASHLKQPVPILIAVPGLNVASVAYNIVKLIYSLYVHTSLQQKVTKELLTYHMDGTNTGFIFPVYDATITPTCHQKRNDFLNLLLEVDNQKHIQPMPIACRNVAISLGNYSHKNSIMDNRFIPAGEDWINFNALIYRFTLSSAKYVTVGDGHKLFVRRKFGALPWSPLVHHRIRVKNMLEIDNSQGSYLSGAGNLIAASNPIYFPFATLVNLLTDEEFQFSHKPVVSALAINPDLWPSNGSMSMNLQSMNLMYNGYDPNGQLLVSDYYGYPHLGNTNNHFAITPFEAIYVDNQINSHIRYKEPVDKLDVPHVNEFIFSEVEPWDLGLQNTNLGENARSNYRYHSYRRAYRSIQVGHLVTPMTDPGDYIAESNAQLTLKAGDYISLKSGVHFKNGSIIHIRAEYEQCNDNKILSDSNEHDNNNETELNDAVLKNDGNIEATNLVKLYPNPVSDMLNIECLTSVPINSIEIYTPAGNRIYTNRNSSTQFRISTSTFQSGVYLVKSNLENGESITLKFIKL